MAGLFDQKVRVLNEIFRESDPNDFAVLVEPVAYECIVCSDVLMSGYSCLKKRR